MKWPQTSWPLARCPSEWPNWRRAGGARHPVAASAAPPLIIIIFLGRPVRACVSECMCVGFLLDRGDLLVRTGRRRPDQMQAPPMQSLASIRVGRCAGQIRSRGFCERAAAERLSVASGDGQPLRARLGGSAPPRQACAKRVPLEHRRRPMEQSDESDGAPLQQCARAGPFPRAESPARKTHTLAGAKTETEAAATSY
jgi:hypothetical protein